MSAAETALFALRRASLHDFGRSAGLLRRRAHRLMQQPKSVLMTVLITNTAVNVAIYALSFVALQNLGENHPALAGAAGAGVLLSVIVFGEVVPKAMALGNAQRLAPSAAGMIWALQTVLGPLQWFLSALLVDPITRLLSPASPPPDTVDTEELQLLVEHSAREGHINSTENEMLQAIVELAEASVREVMTPRVDIEFIRAGDDLRKAYQTVKQSHRRIFPVCGRDLDDIRGLLFARDALLTTGAAIHSLVRPVRFVPEQINLAQLARHFHDERSHFAIVVDEYGGTAGLVTVDDVVEWIVGGLPDSEAPRTAPVTERIDDNTYRLAGDLSVRDWAERFAVDEIDRHIDT
ncbi:MAG: hemolysin family protein, partial [Planctomycetota bacterium]